MSKVKVFSTPTCPWCMKAKQFLEEHNIEFDYIDVTKDTEARDEMVEKSGQMGVPVIMIDDNVIVGFNQDAVMKALDIK